MAIDDKLTKMNKMIKILLLKTKSYFRIGKAIDLHVRLRLTIVIISVFLSMPVFAGGGLTITTSGHGTIGDTLKLNAGTGVQSILWKRNGVTIKSNYYNPYLGYGITVAGKGYTLSNSDSFHLNDPIGVCVDLAGNIYVADRNNNRIQKWAPGAKYGITVAGSKSGASGSDSAHFNSPDDVRVDKFGNIYVSDLYNNRVQKWAAGASYGVTVAGSKSGTSGSDSLHLNGPRALFLDSGDNVYVTDGYNNRIQEWAAGAGYGITVAGNKGGASGSDSLHLNYPCYVYVDKSNNVYITDQHNNRVQEWKSGVKYGITVAGNKAGVSGSDSMHLYNPAGVFVDSVGSVFVGDLLNSRIQKWVQGAKYGTTVAGNKGGVSGLDSLHLYDPYNVFVDKNENIYIADANNNRIEEWEVSQLASSDNYIINGSGLYLAIVTYSNGEIDTASININLSSIKTILTSGYSCIGDTININAGTGVESINWTHNGAVLKSESYNPYLGYGFTLAGQKNGASGSDSTHLNYPTDVFVDSSGNIYVADFKNNRVQKWAPGAKYGVTVAGSPSGVSGSDSAHLDGPDGVRVDAKGNIYVSDEYNNRVQKWAPGAKYGLTVAGNKSGTSGSDAYHFNAPRALFLDDSGNIFVSDGYNNRVQKWAHGATYGTTVAGNSSGTSGSGAAYLNYPCNIFIDDSANVYVTDQHNNRTQKWKPGSSAGTTVAGSSVGSSGSGAAYLNNPAGLWVDIKGNVFVGDLFNNRIQKWAPGASSGTTVAGNSGGTSGTDSLLLYDPYNLFIDGIGNMYISDNGNNRIQEWGLNQLSIFDNYVIKDTGTYTVTISYANNNVDAITRIVNPTPIAKVGKPTTICLGSFTMIGDTSIVGQTYHWTSNPAGFADTTSNPSVSPTTTTTYYLNQKSVLTACSGSDSVVITVNPLPTANAGSNGTICKGGSATIGAAAVSGDTYSWTSNPSGFSSTASNPNVSPTATTTYYLSESKTATGCSKSDSVIIIVNPLPVANAGSNSAICAGSSAAIGAPAVLGDTYSWTSNPSGYSSTASNPNVNPMANTTYYLTENITATGCGKLDSVTITVNPLPVANAGSNRALCAGGSATIGASAVLGDAYSWTSNPSGFSSTVSNPNVSPTVNTTYYLTESVTATSCSKSDSIVITVNPLPAANAGSGSAICTGGNASIGSTAVFGNTYSWISNPSGFSSTTSNPNVNPTVNTTYYLTENITATGCSKSDSVILTVNPLPAANTGSNIAICIGGNNTIGATAVSGDTYSWASNPSGFSGTASNPNISPTLTTTYKLTESITATGCSKSDSVIITVNPLPAASVGSNSAICSGNSVSIGTTAVSGDTYSWASNPFGYSSTASNPNVSPLITTTYFLTESITATGCSKSDSVAITVNSLPNASFSSSINNKTTKFSPADTTLTSYKWSFGDGNTDTSVKPIHTYTTYGNYNVKLITKNSNGCINSDSLTITIKSLYTSFGVNDTNCTYTAVSFGDSSVSYSCGTVNAWVWNFGDGDTSSVQNPSHTYNTAGTYTVKLVASSSGGCTDSFSKNIYVDSTCVWPGDANHNKLVEISDILNIGIAFNAKGAKRSSVSNVWQGQHCDNWGTKFSSGYDYKQADCNGDGIIDSLDLAAISLNWGNSHPKADMTTQTNSSDPALYLQYTKDSFQAGDTVHASIILGDSSSQIQSIYGLAFTLNYDTNYVDSGSVVTFITSSWLGTPGTNLISYTHTNYSAGQVDIAIVRTNHKNVSGYGKIGDLDIVMPDNIAGKTSTISKTVIFKAVQVKAVEANETPVKIYMPDDSFKAYQLDDIYPVKNNIADVHIYPNPTHDYLYIDAGNNTIVSATIYDVFGNKVFTSQMKDAKPAVIPVSSLSDGVYMARLIFDSGEYVTRFIKE